MIKGRWQDVLDQLSTYDAVFFHAFPLNVEEFEKYVLNSITFPEHFFPEAARLLKPGGVFGLWSNGMPENNFLAILSRVFDQVDGHVVEFDNPIQGKMTANGVYVAKIADS